MRHARTQNLIISPVSNVHVHWKQRGYVLFLGEKKKLIFMLRET